MIVIRMAVIIEYFENYWFVLINFLLSYIEYIFGITLRFLFKRKLLSIKKFELMKIKSLIHLGYVKLRKIDE